MILTVTLNLALDVTYRVATVHVHAANRVTAIAERAGGKGVNVARVLQALGHETVVCGLLSLGADGLLAVTPDECWRAAPPARVGGNPTGAGDAAVAAPTAGLVAGLPWPERLAQAIAVSAAAVGAPVAGSFDPELYRRLLSEKGKNHHVHP
jgi:fructose-1-phosphate kinase PfkB-like protein